MATGKLTLIAVTGAAGGAAMYFLDPQQGNRRRSVARDRAGAILRRGRREVARKGDYAAGQVRGAAHEARDSVTPDAPKAAMTGQELARKVESVIFRDADAPKGTVDVDAVGNTVWLRGEVPSDEVRERLLSEARAIPEVERVEDLTHLPGMPAPTRADAPAAMRRDTTHPDAPRAPEAADTATGDQTSVVDQEPTPAESAASGTGRRAAPLGSKDEGSDGEES